VICTAVIVLTEDREGLDAKKHGEGPNAVGGTERPDWTEAGKLCSEAGLNAFADVQPERHFLVSIELDRSAARAAKHLAAELATGAVEKRPVNPARLVGHDIAKERHHAAHTRTFVMKRRMEPDHVAGDVIGKLETALGYEVALD
jgi:hypothetical protein